MEDNSKSYIVIVILLNYDLTVALDGTCTPGYYACVGTWGCCPSGYDCTATKCTQLHYYYSSESSSSSVGPIIGYCIGGIFGLFVLGAFLVACCEKCKQSCEKSGQVGSMDTQTSGRNRTATAIRY